MSSDFDVLATIPGCLAPFAVEVSLIRYHVMVWTLTQQFTHVCGWEVEAQQARSISSLSDLG